MKSCNINGVHAQDSTVCKPQCNRHCQGIGETAHRGVYLRYFGLPSVVKNVNRPDTRNRNRRAGTGTGCETVPRRRLAILRCQWGDGEPYRERLDQDRDSRVAVWVELKMPSMLSLTSACYSPHRFPDASKTIPAKLWAHSVAGVTPLKVAQRGPGIW